MIPELLRRAHAVRLLSRHAEEDAHPWKRVEPFAGNIAEPQSLRGAAGGCNAIIHIAAIVKIDAGGTRNILAEAARAGVRRFLFISSLGADRGSSESQRSLSAGEDLVQRSGLAWTIVRAGAVYGPGDELISTILKMVRALPAIPVVNGGAQLFQPIWFEDLGLAIAKVLEDDDSAHRTCDIAGSETTSLHDLIRRFGTITGRNPVRVPVPKALASIGAKIAALAVHVPVDDVNLTMRRESNVLSDPAAHPLADLGITETTLDRGLRLLADSIPEQLAEDGVGAMQKKKFWADINGSRLPAVALMSYFRDHVNEVMPIDFAAEPGAPTRIDPGVTMTARLPVRGNIQIRVERAEATHVVFATVEGHPIAGIVEFRTQDLDGGRVRFAIEVSARAANVFDVVALRTAGDPAQSANWRTVVQRMIDASGGTSDGVRQEAHPLDERDAAQIEKKVRSLIQSRKRDESALPERPA